MLFWASGVGAYISILVILCGFIKNDSNRSLDIYLEQPLKAKYHQPRVCINYSKMPACSFDI